MVYAQTTQKPTDQEKKSGKFKTQQKGLRPYKLHSLERVIYRFYCRMSGIQKSPLSLSTVRMSEKHWGNFHFFIWLAKKRVPRSDLKRKEKFNTLFESAPIFASWLICVAVPKFQKSTTFI